MTKLLYSSLMGLAIGVLILGRPLSAQELTVVEDFSLSAPDSQVVKLSDYQDQKAIVVVFTSSHCSWATQYIERLQKLHKRYAEQNVSFIAINSNDPTLSQRDAEARMQKIAKYDFPYLKDKDQAVARLFEITKNPEAVVLIPAEEGFQMVYRGKIDDNPLDASMVKNAFLDLAIQAAIAGEDPETETTIPNGCSIKWIEAGK
ncbi:MAG: redoxin domain-containing protein [Bacteroidota bacterium]